MGLPSAGQDGPDVDDDLSIDTKSTADTVMVSNCDNYTGDDTDSQASLVDILEWDDDFATIGIRSVQIEHIPLDSPSSDIHYFDSNRISHPAPDHSEGPPCLHISEINKSAQRHIQPGQGHLDGGSQATTTPDTTYVHHYRPYGPDFPCPT